MRKIKLSIPIIITFLLTGCETHKELNVLSTRNIVSDTKKTTILYVITDIYQFENYTICSKDIISHCIKNDFKNVKFSYDIEGYPYEIISYIYSSQSNFKNNTPAFKIVFTPKSDIATSTYTIKDNTNEYIYNVTTY